MRLVSQQAISRTTRGSGRTLVSLSFVVWFVKFYDAPIEDIVISGVGLSDSSRGYALVQWIVLVPLLAYHVLNWFGDWLSYRAWNDPTKVTATSGFGSATGLMSRLDSVLRTVQEKIIDGGNNTQEQRIAVDMLKEISSQVRLLGSFVGLYLLIWFLFPVACSAIALFWSDR